MRVRSTLTRLIALATISCPALLNAQGTAGHGNGDGDSEPDGDLRSGAAARGIQLVDATQAAQIDVTHSFPDVPGSLTQRASGGVAIGDYDRDGLLDLFVATGKGRATALLRNQGDGTFADVATAAGVALEGVNNCGPLFFDYDGDGFPDLF